MSIDGLTPAQVRAARALLGWSQRDLASRSRIALSTVADFERGQRIPVPNNLDAMRSSLEASGVAFLVGGAVVGPAPRHPTAKASGSPIRWIDATDLAHWADRRDGQDTMPELISRLIRAARGLGARLNFPSGDSVQQGGWDGVCEVAEGHAYVPQGHSGWEIGTQREGIKKKADADYEKRVADSKGVDQAQATFVFVTPRRWPGKREWALKRKNEGKWANVIAYDADDLVHWIELFPQVAHWLASLIGKRPTGIRQLSDAWEEWSLSTKWRMNADLLLAGRDEEAARVLRWLYDEAAALAVQGNSIGEAIAFLHAATDQLPLEYRNNYQQRCLIAAGSDVARLLGDSPSPLILILEDIDVGLATKLVQRGHHVYFVYGSAIGAPDEGIRLPRAPWEAFSSALLAMGIEKEEAERLTRESARNLAVVRRLIPSAPGRMPPSWAEADCARALVAPLLVGAWNEADDGDKRLLENLSGDSYDVLSGRLARWVGQPDGPFRRAGSAWKVASPLDAWFLLAPNISSADLDRFGGLVIEVLSAVDPRFEMSDEERWLAPLRGGKPEHSGLLRTGLCETLVLLSMFGNQIVSVSDANKRPQAIVRSLLDSADSRRWWSLSPQLRVLAEASPEAFLDALDQSLSQNTPPVMALFREDAGLLGGAHHSELLWALETLAWSPKYLTRVTELLAKLTRLDPGGRYANRPENSLLNVFRLWLPQTHASLDERLRVLEHLRKVEPEISWRLMLALLPGGYDTASPSPQPRWRDFATKQDEVVTYGVIGKGTKIIAEWMLADVQLSSTRWKQVFEVYPKLPPDGRKQAVDQLLAAAPHIGDDGSRAEIWEALRGLLHHHRAFVGAQWALPEEELKPVDGAYAAIEPRSIVTRLVWLFASPGAALPTPANNDWQADEESSRVLRKAAAEQLLAQGDMETIFSVASAAKMPALLGLAIVEADFGEGLKEEVLLSALQTDDSKTANLLALGMIQGYLNRDGNSWTESFIDRSGIKTWPKERISKVLLMLPPARQTWERAARFGKDVEKLYWSQAGILGVSSELEDIMFVVEKLLGAGRAREAVHLVGYRGKELSAPIIVKVLEEGAKEPWPERANGNDATMFLYAVEQLLQRLDKAEDVPEGQLARLEWMYLPVLEQSRRPPIVLHQTMSREPSFFVEVLSAIYRPSPESGIKEETEVDNQRARAMASRAYGLLRSWHQIPGEQGGVVNASALEEWVRQARILCSEVGRLAVGDQHIGSMLAAAPSDGDGVWPTKAVREIVEITRSRELEDGVLLGILNSRGVTRRGLTDGGTQERAIAKQYHEWAEATALEWPRTSALLERIAGSYEEHGEWHDQNAERTDWSF